MSTASPRPSSEPASPAAVADALFGLYAEHGRTFYDATVTQNEHALQSAALADADGAGDALVVAALLHDIGHLLVDEHAGHEGFLAGDLEHERVGAAVLERWFPPSVTGPIALHVPAKRYLVATDPAYAGGLSEASTRSLVVQGGPMTEAQAAAFRSSPHAEPACRLRRWDDRAKSADTATRPFEHYRAAVEGLAAGSPAFDRRSRTSSTS
jgi:phosphonate degradation associated HDIG domain protein